MRELLLFAFISVILTLSSCDGKDEGIPAYIQIDTVSVRINNEVEEGSSNHAITDVWVYIDDVYQGNYEVPAKFPVLNTGNHKITLRAGIKLNGIAATREEYPFYQYIDIDTVLTESKVMTIAPEFSYIENASFWIEDFNQADIKIWRTPQTNTDTVIQHVEDTAHTDPQLYFGGIFVDATRPNFIGATNLETDPIFYYDADRRLMLEMQYKNNQAFYVGLLTQTKKIDIEMLMPSTEWKTIYIDLTPWIKKNPTEKYALAYWTMYDGEKQGKILLNNIKLVKYE